MTNADDSAMPTIEQTGNPDCWNTYPGLTKREFFAAMFMEGLLSSMGGHDVTDYEEMAHDAAMATDALINELNK